jgi:TonB family protein
MNADWATLEGQLIRGAFPLLRLLGSSEGSAVFLSRAATMTPSDVALKLVPAIPGQAELLLPRWRSATALDHPHLLRLFEAGECEVGEQRYLYLVMEYAEQNLAQLLETRALGPDEVREMLGPTLRALEFLHGSQRVHGGLKPSNVLVVGEQVKLASDSIGSASDVMNNGSASVAAQSPYQPPEASGGGRSAQGDVWALGVTTCEALSRRRPAGLHAVGGDIVLPPDIPSSFREMISKCLSRKPEDRPDVARLQAWQNGGELESMPAPASAAVPAPEQESGVMNVAQQAAAPSSDSIRLVIRAQLLPQDEAAEPVALKAQWRPMRLIVAAVLLLGIVAAGIYFLSPGEARLEAKSPVADGADAPRPQVASTQAQPTQSQPTQSQPTQAQPTQARPPALPVQKTASDSTSAINEVIPVVPRSASQTIRGTIRVSVRVTVDEDGKVVTATSEDPGPSRYFERLSLDAAKKWTFAPAATEEKRLMRVNFNYARTGTTANTSPTQ